jgi:hypothetical protein
LNCSQDEIVGEESGIENIVLFVQEHCSTTPMDREPEVGKVPFKSNADDVLSNVFSKKVMPTKTL